MTRISRPGLTLIELLVVIGLLIVLATLVVIFVVPAFQDNKNVLRGSDRLTSTLLIARSRAYRDQAPRGVRFQLDSDGFARNLVYIEQPDPYHAGTVTIPANSNQATFAGGNVNLLGSADAGTVEEYAVQPGDWLQVGNENYEIGAVTGATTATLVRTNGAVAVSNQPYTVIRQPRPITGEEAVKLPQNVGINFTMISNLNANYQVPSRTVGASTYYEVLFDPGGKVVNRASNTAIIFWVQDTTAEDSASSNTTRLIVIYPRSALIAAHPVNKTGTAANYLDYALDGKSSGI